MRLALIVSLVIGPFSSLIAQPSLSLQECLRLALERHPLLRSSGSSVRAERNARQAFVKTGYPSVRFQGTLLDAPLTSSLGYDPVLSNEGEIAAQAVVEQQIYDGGVRSSTGAKMDIGIGIAELEQRRIRNSIITDVTSAYIDVLKAQSELRLHSTRVKELENYLAMVKRRWNSGNTPYTDILKTGVACDEARADSVKAAQEKDAALHTLTSATGMEPDAATIFSGDLENLTGTAIDSILLDEGADPAQNADILIDSLAIQSASFDVELARSERRPQISIMGDVGYLNSFENLHLPGDQRSPAFGYSVGINVSHLLYDWGSTGLKVEEKLLRVEALSARHEALRNSIIEQIRTSFSDFRWSKVRLQFLRRSLGDARNGYLLVKAQYSGGGTTSLDVLSAEQSLAGIQLGEISALADVQHALNRYQQLTSR